jgi:dimeric dUTPase (all-alpha-NTP-PPase superfamily)
MELKEFYKLQNKLDKVIVDSNFNTIGDEMYDIHHNDKSFLNDRITALFVEVGEFANATRCFKYWSDKPSESKERLLDEYADILHFVFSIGNTLGFTVEEIEKAYLEKNLINHLRQKEGY